MNVVQIKMQILHHNSLQKYFENIQLLENISIWWSLFSLMIFFTLVYSTLNRFCQIFGINAEQMPDLSFTICFKNSLSNFEIDLKIVLIFVVGLSRQLWCMGITIAISLFLTPQNWIFSSAAFPVLSMVILKFRVTFKVSPTEVPCISVTSDYCQIA